MEVFLHKICGQPVQPPVSMQLRRCTPEQVAHGVEKAITKNRAEVTVAPVTMKASAGFGSLFPDLALRTAKLAGGDKVGAELAEGQKHLR